MKKKKEFNSTFGIGLDWKIRVRFPPKSTYFSMNSGKQSIQHSGDQHRRDYGREGWHSPSRARRPQPHCLLVAQARKSCLGGGRRKMLSAEQQRRCMYRILSALVWVYSCSVVDQYQYVPPVRRIKLGHVGGWDGGPSSAAGAIDKSQLSSLAAPGCPAVTSVDSGGGDDDRWPKTFFNTTSQSTALVAQQADMTGSSQVLRVPKAEMT